MLVIYINDVLNSSSFRRTRNARGKEGRAGAGLRAVEAKPISAMWPYLQFKHCH